MNEKIEQASDGVASELKQEGNKKWARISLQQKLESQCCSDELFKEKYMCDFESNPQIEECVRFLKQSSPDYIKIAENLR